MYRYTRIFKIKKYLELNGSKTPQKLAFYVKRGSVLSVNDLYLDDSFNDFIINLGYVKRIEDFDDFKQEVFLYILEKSNEQLTLYIAKQIANKIAHRIKVRQIKEQTYSYLEGKDIGKDSESMLWEDRNII